MDTIKEIESIRTDILDTIAKCECGDDCESVVYLKKIAGRLSSVSSCCRPLAAAPAASPTPDGAAPSAAAPSVPSVPSNTAKLRETMELFAHANDDGFYGSHQTMYNVVKKAKEALAAPARNCDKVKDHSDAIGKFEKWMDFSPKTADEQDAFFKEHWFEFAMWLIDMNESEPSK